MHSRSNPQDIRRPTVALGLWLICVVAAGVWADPPTTQPTAPPTLEATDPKKDEAPSPPGAVGAPAQRTVQPARPAVQGPRSEYAPDPNAKWACDKMVVELEPVWRQANTNLTFDFTIRNEGTADLKINAKPGG